MVDFKVDDRLSQKFTNPTTVHISLRRMTFNKRCTDVSLHYTAHSSHDTHGHLRAPAIYVHASPDLTIECRTATMFPWRIVSSLPLLRTLIKIYLARKQ